jgi:hypothetical protein
MFAVSVVLNTPPLPFMTEITRASALRSMVVAIGSSPVKYL